MSVEKNLKNLKREVLDSVTSLQEIQEEGYSRADIMATLATLPAKDRSVLILRYFESFQLEQIAEITGENPATVKSRLYRAQKKLKLKLE